MKRLTVAVFLLTELIIYCLLLFGQNVNIPAVCYCGIVFCFIYSLINFEKKTDCIYLCGGLLFTLLSDTFLVFNIDLYTGMCFFITAQIIYMLRVMRCNDNNVLRLIQLALTVILIVTIIKAANAVAGNNTDKLVLISVSYYAIMLSTTVFALVNIKKLPFFFFGLVLFLCCDFVIGMQAIDIFSPFAKGSFGYSIAHPGFNLAWFFYLPAQVMIASSKEKPVS